MAPPTPPRPTAARILALALALACEPPAGDDTGGDTSADSGPTIDISEEPCPGSHVEAGAFSRIYDPSVGELTPWYINDHTFVRGQDGTWHLFGITHAEPEDHHDERIFAHATADTLTQPMWTKRPPALAYAPEDGETVLWAPHVIATPGGYTMFYGAGGHDPTRWMIRAATSPDLETWTRLPGALFLDGFEARDPFVTRIDDRWVMYYTRTDPPAGGNHVVAYRTSDDLLTWSAPAFAFVDPKTGTNGGPTESPFVVERDGLYYLFIGPRGGYVGTDVFASADPYHFTAEGLVGHVDAHAAEVITDTDGATYVSHAGWSQGGVYLAPLAWDPGECIAVRTPFYELLVQTRPTASIAALGVSPGGLADYRPVLRADYRGTRPYLGVGGWATDLAGPAAEVDVDAAAHTLALRRIPIGDEPITVDWSFDLDREAFDFALTWRVDAEPSAPVWEAGWSLDTDLTEVGDDLAPARPRGNIGGFPRWIRAADDAIALIVAYAGDSAWMTANRWFHGDVGVIAWQTLWAPGGERWGPGVYPGGRWRIGAARPQDEPAYAPDLWGAINPAP